MMVVMTVGVRSQARRARHGIVTMTHCNLLGVRSSKCHHALDSFDMSLVLFALLLLSLPRLALSGLGRCPSLELASDKLQVVRNLNSTFEEEELQVAGLVLELHLVAIFQGFTDGASRPEHR